VEHNSHATSDQLEDYVLGRLPASDVDGLEEHLMVCAECRARLGEIEDFVGGVKEALGEEKPRTAAAHQIDWFGWVRCPAFSIAIGFAALIIVVGILASGRTKLAPMAALQLTAMRGEMPATVPANQFELTLSDAPREGGTFRIEVVNAMGEPVWLGLAVSGPAGLQTRLIRPLMPGDYFARLYDSSDKIVREYGFRIR